LTKETSLQWYVRVFLSSMQESAVFTAGCMAVALAGVYLYGVPFTDALGFVLLVVSAGLMLVGGAMSFISPAKVKIVNLAMKSKIKATEDDYAKNMQRAALYATTGVLLFGYSLLLAAFVG
jgi:hypothetical protein